MKKNLTFSLFVFIALFACLCCNGVYQSELFPTKIYCINNNKQKGVVVLMLIKPYGGSINKSLNDPEGLEEKTPREKQPEPIPVNLPAEKYRKNQSCDMVICLSNQPYPYKESNNVSGGMPAEENNVVALIPGGLIYTFFENPITCKSKKDNEIILNQVGWTSIFSGRLDFDFTSFSGKKLVKSQTISVSQKTDG